TVIGIDRAPTVLDAHVTTDGPTQLLQLLRQRGDAGRCFQIVGGQGHEHADAPHPLGLLRACRERPSCCRAPERDEPAPVHSITSSARATSSGGKSRPSARVLLRLIANSNFVGCSIGRSAGLVPCKILCT